MKQWVRVDMTASNYYRAAHLFLRRVDFMDVNVPYRGWDHNESALFTPRVADVVEVWNAAARNGQDAFGGITRKQFLEEYVKQAFAIDREEYAAAKAAAVRPKAMR